MTYSSKALLAALLTMPLVLRLPRAAVAAEAAILDIFLIANLMYFRTYRTCIPASSYGLAGNLPEFAASVADQLRWSDALFPATTIILILALRYMPRPNFTVKQIAACAVSVAAFGLVLWCCLLPGGGFRRNYESTQSFVQKYSVFGTLLYECMDNRPEMTAQTIADIEGFTEPAGGVEPPPVLRPVPPAIVVVILESFESWVLESVVEGVEITPCINRLLKEASTLYAPHVLTQVKGGRSIDAQLLLTAGLLPVKNGVYSQLYPYSTYETLVKAYSEQCPDTRAYAFTPDRGSFWNQRVVAAQFGFDAMFDRNDFSRSEVSGVGTGRLVDGAFLAECIEKIDSLKRESGDAHMYLQCVTFSGHSPFIIPDRLKAVSFSDNIPRRMNDYMTVANYTDAAVGRFVGELRRRPGFADAMIVIVGDHEGLASDRADMVADKAGAGVVSGENFTPFIVLGSPVGMRYEDVMGQIDMYPTLLDLAGLDSYRWRGLGRSILREGAPRGAVDPSFELCGRAEPDELRRMTDAWRYSDTIIRGDYFGHSSAGQP